MKVLIVEDEKAISDAVFKYLKKEYYISDVASSYLSASQSINDNDYDCVIIDIGLPDGTGLDLISEIKKQSLLTGIIIVSAKGALEDRIAGLKLGADDYVTKPFHMPELVARIDALMRRRYYDASNTLRCREIEVELEGRLVKVNDSALALTNKEYELLLFFISNKNKVLSKQSLSEHLWENGMDASHNYDFLYAQVKNLRKKINAFGGADRIKTIYGLGYKFSDDEIT